MNDICKCKIKGRSTTPQCEHDERVNMKMKSVTSDYGFFRVCLICDKSTYSRNGKVHTDIGSLTVDLLDEVSENLFTKLIKCCNHNNHCYQQVGETSRCSGFEYSMKYMRTLITKEECIFCNEKRNVITLTKEFNPFEIRFEIIPKGRHIPGYGNPVTKIRILSVKTRGKDIDISDRKNTRFKTSSDFKNEILNIKSIAKQIAEKF